MYQKVGSISEETRQALLSQLGNFRQTGKPGDKANYQSIGETPLIKHPELWDIWPLHTWQRAFAVKLVPGGYTHYHKHPDDGHAKHHIVLSTNDQCESWNGGELHRLEDLGVYRMEPNLMHQSFNYGQSDRIHLIYEIAE